jgi:Na+/melibiose symporter-like transporter
MDLVQAQKSQIIKQQTKIMKTLFMIALFKRVRRRVSRLSPKQASPQNNFDKKALNQNEYRNWWKRLIVLLFYILVVVLI